MRKKVGENRKIRQAFHHHNVFAHENASHLAHHLLQGAEKWIPNYQISERRLAELDAPVGHKFFPHFFHGWSGNPVRTRRNLLHTICSENLTKNMMDSPRRSPVNVIVLDSSWWTWLPNSFIVLWTKLVLKIDQYRKLWWKQSQVLYTFYNCSHEMAKADWCHKPRAFRRCWEEIYFS